MNKDLTTGPILKTLFLFFVPILLGTLFQQLYNTVDTIIVGNVLGTHALAAMGSTVHLTSFVVYFFVGLSTGSGVVISKQYGAKEEGIAKTIVTSFYMACFCGLVMMLFGLFLAGDCLEYLGVPKDVLPLATHYIQIYFLSMIPGCVYNVGASILRGLGDSKTPLYYLIVCSLLNIALDLLFVIGLDMWVTGAAIATTLSQSVCALLVSCQIYKREIVGKIKDYKMNREILKQILKVGIPSGLQSNMWSVSNLFIQAHVNLFGTYAIAGLAVYEKVEDLFWMVMAAITTAITTFTSQNYGAKQYQRIEKGRKQILCSAICLSALFSVVILTCGETLAGFFTHDTKTIEQFMIIVHTLALFYFAYSFVAVNSGVMCGYGHATLPLVISFFTTCLLRILIVTFISPMFNTFGAVMMAYCTTWCVSGLTFFIVMFPFNRSIQK